jgi:hypothetical protein
MKIGIRVQRSSKRSEHGCGYALDIWKRVTGTVHVFGRIRHEFTNEKGLLDEQMDMNEGGFGDTKGAKGAATCG